MDQVKVYAKFEFDWEQMWEIRWGFKDGLTMEQVRLYTNPKINEEQMRQICLDLENSLIIEEVKEKYGL